MGTKLVSINIERSKHLDTVIPFVYAQKPDVITLQEVMERDVPLFEKEFGMQCFYVPVLVFAAGTGEKEGVEGTAIFARDFKSRGSTYYAGQSEPLARFTEEKDEKKSQVAKMLVHADIAVGDVTYKIATTHFTWTAKGEATELQLQDLQKLLVALEPLGEFVFTGDFNAPRGRETWNRLAARYKDNIPARYTSSIDPMHQAGPLPYLVDGIFSTPEYYVENVELHEGISDHKAVTATIQKV